MTIYYCTLPACRFCVNVMKDTVSSICSENVTKNGENKPHLRARNFILIKKLHYLKKGVDKKGSKI